jgi:glycosyltransferase involved in cell wall biosynthesis
VPRSDQDAGSVMIFNFIKIFRNLGYAVTFLPVDLTYDPYYTPLLEKLGVVCLHSPEVRSLHQHLAACGANYDLVLTCRPDFTDPILHLLKVFCPQAKIIYETHDLHFIREQRQAEIEKKPEMLVQAAQRKLQELRIAATVDCTLVVSEQEREALLKENPELSVEVIPVISEIFGCRASFANRRDLVFIGGYEHRPNVDAVIFFVRDILPLVIQQIPDICLHVVGSHPPEEITSLASKNVVIHGFVRDITELMDRVKISVNPLRFGAGVKGKVVTSMSYGVPCIGTGIAVEGMGVVAGQQALVADDPEAFAQAVVQLSKDQALWDKLSAESLDFVLQRFSLEVAEASFVRIFENLIPVKACKSFALERVTSYDQFCNLERDKEIAHHQEIEASFAAKQEPINTDGFCFICNQRVLFGTDLQYGFPQPDGGCLPNWRERMVCPDCQLNNRIRASIHLFHLLCNPTPESHLYLTEQVTPLFTWFQNNYPHVTGSEYLGTTVARGMINQSGFRNEDLTQLTFADEEFDAILSFDVFEYIPDYLQAMRECLRCLKPEGELFFSVPFNHQSRQNIVRAEIDADGELNHLLPPEYHGNPISENGCLCYYHFGWELLEQLRGLGFSDVATYIYWSEDFGYLGGDQLIFRATK